MTEFADYNRLATIT